MSTYSGAAELIDGLGQKVADVEVNLRKTEATEGRLGSWSGSMTGSGYYADDIVGGTFTLRLPHGGEGQVIGVSASLGANAGPVQLRGSGPPPF